MGFFKRLFSSDYRSAVAAEAVGDLDLAAERYALAGRPEAAVRVHLARADRSDKRSDEIAALRDALHWAPEGSELRKIVAGRLGRALLARVKAEGVATARDKERVRDAARLLTVAGLYERAGTALEEIGDDQGAAAAFRKGGLVDRLEAALGRQEKQRKRERTERESFADYNLHIKSGDRDLALDSIRRAVQAAAQKAEYRRLQDDLETRIITSGKLVLRVRGGPETALCTGPSVLFGRDATCDVVLRSGGISRRHAEITVAKNGVFHLRDAGSRNGTKIHGLPISGTVPLKGSGEFQLGDECTVSFRTEGEALVAKVSSGVDAGTGVHIAAEGDVIDLEQPPVTIRFRAGRPILSRDRVGFSLILNGDKLAHGDVQLIHGDQIAVDGVEFEVA